MTLASQTNTLVAAFGAEWTAESQSPQGIRTTYDDVKAWYTKSQPEPNEISGVTGPNNFGNSVKFALGLMMRGTQGYQGDFPMSYVFPILDTTEDYQRLLDDMDVARRLGQMIQIQYFLLRKKYEDDWFLDKSHRPKLLNFFTMFREHFSSENWVDDFSILRTREGDEVAEALNAMIDVIKNSADEDPRLPEDLPEYIVPTRNTNFGRGMQMQRNFIDNKFEPDPERPVAGYWKTGACWFLRDGEPVTET